jgi:hypothetical protein
MTLYEVQFIGRSGQVINTVEIDAESDEAAIAHSHRIDVASIDDGFVIWEDSRLVHRYQRAMSDSAPG